MVLGLFVNLSFRPIIYFEGKIVMFEDKVKFANRTEYRLSHGQTLANRTKPGLSFQL
jgi:hypothetical protein